MLKRLTERGPEGGQVNVVVRAKCHNENMRIVFLLLSDGWSSIWAAIEANNLLYDYVIDSRKIRVGSKICICQWYRHPIANILDFCPAVTRESPTQCIEFTYNGSIILQPNAKLGASTFNFCRPLSRCKFKGGTIPSLYGTVIRFITLKDVTRREKEAGLSTHVLEMLLKGGSTCFVKFVLA